MPDLVLGGFCVTLEWIVSFCLLGILGEVFSCEGFQGEFVVRHFGDVGAIPPPRCLQVSDEFAGGREGEDAGYVPVGGFVGVGLDKGGGDGVVAR